jgi:hypothetical protein
MYTGKLVIKSYTSTDALRVSTESIKWNMKVMTNMFLEKKSAVPI